MSAKAGIQAKRGDGNEMDAGVRRHDDSTKQAYGGLPAISFSADERKLMNTSW
jgi:hypothetical protein